MDRKERKQLLVDLLQEASLEKLAQETMPPATQDPQAGEQFAEKVYDKFVEDILLELDRELSVS